MGKSFAGVILGAVLGGFGSLMASMSSVPESGAYYTRNVLCLVIGAGLWAVAGAVVGGTSAIIDAIRSGRNAGTG